jgi:hypothetical protein
MSLASWDSGRQGARGYRDGHKDVSFRRRDVV